MLCRVVMEVGTHSPWASHLVESLGHEVLVANARRVRAIYDCDNKSDKIDAEKLAPTLGSFPAGTPQGSPTRSSRSRKRVIGS